VRPALKWPRRRKFRYELPLRSGNSMVWGMGDALRQFLAFVEPLTEPTSHRDVAGDEQVLTSDGRATRGVAASGVFASHALITQTDSGAAATDAQAPLPRAA
jgi:hypothetical protein